MRRFNPHTRRANNLFLTGLILAALVLAGAGVCYGQEAKLPPLPDSVPSALGWVRVLKVPNLQCQSSSGPVDAYGCFSSMRRVIAVRDSMPLIMSWVSLEHERKHLEFFDAGVRFENPAYEDMLCRVLSVARVNEMLQVRP